MAEVQRVVRAWPSKGETVAAESSGPITLLDIGTGLGDIPRAAQRLAARGAIPMTTIGVELVPALARAAGTACTHALAADAMALLERRIRFDPDLWIVEVEDRKGMAGLTATP